MISAVAIFCEDIREEKSGQDTIVGTLPDYLAIENAPQISSSRPMLPRLAMYARIQFDIDETPGDIAVALLDANGAVVAQTGFDPAVVKKSFSDTKANKMPLVNLIMKVIIGPFPIVRPGKIIAKLKIGDSERVIGALNVMIGGTKAA